MSRLCCVLTKCDRCCPYSVFKKDFTVKSLQLADNRFTCEWKDRWPCLEDATQGTPFDSHYLFHTAWAARILSHQKPPVHVDISSCIRFATLVSAFIPVDFYDFRPASLNLKGLTSQHGDVTHLPFSNNSIHSLSCMHVVEHIGLERYGDPFDPSGDIKAMAELKRVLAVGGNLLLVVPVGKARIQYNAHRIYDPQQILNYFSSLELQSFGLITDHGEYKEHATIEEGKQQSYGCGCFHFVNRSKVLS